MLDAGVQLCKNDGIRSAHLPCLASSSKIIVESVLLYVSSSCMPLFVGGGGVGNIGHNRTYPPRSLLLCFVELGGELGREHFPIPHPWLAGRECGCGRILWVWRWATIIVIYLLQFIINVNIHSVYFYYHVKDSLFFVLPSMLRLFSLSTCSTCSDTWLNSSEWLVIYWSIRSSI